MSTKDQRHVVVLVLPGSRWLDFGGLLDVVDRVTGGYACVVAGASTPLPMAGGGMGIPCASVHELRQPIDTLLVASSSMAFDPVERGELIGWLRQAASRARRIGAMSTGVFLLAETGLLDGRQATTDWRHCEELARRYPKMKVKPDAMLVRDGAILTAAGITAGLYLALGLVEEDHGYDLALKLARELEIHLRPPGAQPEVSAGPQRLATTAPIRELQLWISSHLQESLNVKRLAAVTGMSPRQLAREFVQDLGKTPAKYVEEVRVEAARVLLERTAAGLDRIAPQCGFGSVDSMRRAFLRTLHTLPAAYRSHFRKMPV